MLLYLLVEPELEHVHLLSPVGQFGSDVRLKTAQQRRSKSHVETLDDEQCLFSAEHRTTFAASLSERCVESFVEALDRVEDQSKHKADPDQSWR